MSDPQSMPIPSSELAPDARAGIYALVATGWRYPDESWGTCILDPRALDCVLGDLQSISPPLAVECKKTGAMCSLLGNEPLPAVLSDLRADHVRLFGHAVRGSCPLYELEYGRSEIIQQTAELADLSGFYSAYGLQMMDSAFERPDHIAVECEFMSVLCAKEAWGRQQGDGGLAESCFDAQRLFLRDHLAKWLPAFARRVEAMDADGLYGRIASLARTFIEDECRRFDIEVGPQWLELRPADPERDATIDCEPADCGAGVTNQLVQLGVGRSSE